ncbi:Hypothetical protein MVR_LOCUS26 [uncultured virus]|nr:Hypothetical protein MVR_LOCUS26 [uncultured virus]
MPTDNLKGRSHYYPKDKNWIDTTHYDSTEGSLDLGYQKLKQINTKDYPQFAVLTKLFVDHNELTSLPDPQYMPNLEYLTCKANKLTTIPFYPKLKFLNIAENSIKSCSLYNNSQLEYFDCSHNPDFTFDLRLSVCVHLYIEHVNLKSFNLALVPALQYIDCSNNQLTRLEGIAPQLKELAVSRNNLIELVSGCYPKLEVLIADHNSITELQTFPLLQTLTIDNNELVSIASQPRLTRLSASYNGLNHIGAMPALDFTDLSWNRLRTYSIPDTIEYATLYFNPLTIVTLSPALLTSIKELRINYTTYLNIYKQYYDNFRAIDMQVNSDRLRLLLTRMETELGISASISNYIYQQFKTLKFRERETELERITVSIYNKTFTLDRTSSMKILRSNPDYIKLLKDLTDLYQCTLMITLYFNGYYN